MPENQQEAPHLPVLLDETISLLGTIEDGWVVDATVGFGGHSEAVLETFPHAKVIGLDQDWAALELAKERLERFGSRVELVHSNFSEIKDVIVQRSITNVTAVIGQTWGFFNADRQRDPRLQFPVRCSTRHANGRNIPI
jgi:16S rRNA (cytosine1402-N4)-methyltransferase